MTQGLPMANKAEVADHLLTTVSEATPWLHLRGQFTYHAEATIKGTRAGLTILRNAIDEALTNGRAEASVFASDGEGYGVEVTRSRTVSGIGQPTYLDNEARELARYEQQYLVRESKMLRKQNAEGLAALRWCRKNGNPHVAQGDQS